MYTEENVKLYFTQGSSDKEYRVSLKKAAELGGGWLVNFAYGRRNGPLKTGTKTKESIGYEKAKKAYDRLILSKIQKGYVSNASGEAAAVTLNGKETEQTEYLPQLLNEVFPEDLQAVYTRFSPEVYVQIKHDGERRGVIITDGDIIYANRRGLRRTIDSTVAASVTKLFADTGWEGTMDCEDMGDHLIIFDWLPYPDTAEYTFAQRAQNLPPLLHRIQALNLPHLVVAIPEHMEDLQALQAYVYAAQQNKEEGIVIRDGFGQYAPGKPSQADVSPALKLKFWKDCTCRVQSVHESKSSIALELRHPVTGWTFVGNCTIPSGYSMPVAGQLVDIKYLYAYRGGSIYQPQYKGVRTDLENTAATTEQLIYKKGQ